MRKLLIGLLLLPCLGLAAGDDLLINQRNTADTATLSRVVAHPVGANGLLGYSSVSGLPVFFTYGPSLVVAGGVLNATPQDWATITGKPPLFSGAYSALTGVPTAFAPSAHTHAATDIVSGTLAAARLPALAISQTTGLQAAIDSKFNIPTGTALQYVRGDGVLATLPVAKRIETYTGTTNASGQMIVTYPLAFAQVPNVQTPPPALPNQVWTLTASTVNGFTAVLSQRNVVTLLGLEVLLGAVVPVASSAAQIVVIER